MIELGRTIVNNPTVATELEWLVTNGMGGYACGTVSSVLTRGYHGLLLAALNPPLGRTLLVTKIDETLHYLGRSIPLFSNSWAPDSIYGDGYCNLDHFRLEGTIPVWTWAFDDALVEKRLWMEQGSNTTWVRYTVVRASEPIEFGGRTLVNYRDYHAATTGGWQMAVDPVENGVRVHAFDTAVPFYLLSADAAAMPAHQWYRNYHRAVEAYRGQIAREDNLYAAEFTATLAAGESLTLAFTTDPTLDLDGETALGRQQAHEQAILNTAYQNNYLARTPHIDQLLLAADQFIVARATDVDPDGRTVIAGYPWFSDWGRDTMIALPGLTLATGRYEIARSILLTFSRFVSDGMLPNRFPDSNEEPEYNTADATLWYFEALKQYIDASGDWAILAELYPILTDIIDWHVRGTRYHIKQTEADRLLYAGEDGVQLTWMDAKVDDWVVTPRIGKPVEINALWYNALLIVAEFADHLDRDGDTYRAMAAQVRDGFQRFWNAEAGYCYDVIEGPRGLDSSLRPNQLLAVSLTHSALSAEQQQQVVDVCARQLLTPHGMRSLAPSSAEYVGIYGGDRVARDGSYHQGTTWGWLIGPFVAAHLKVYDDKVAARHYLMPLLRHLQQGCVGSISEIFDGDAPFLPRGCFAQAWSVAELLRLWQMTE